MVINDIASLDSFFRLMLNLVLNIEVLNPFLELKNRSHNYPATIPKAVIFGMVMAVKTFYLWCLRQTRFNSGLTLVP